MKTILGAVLLTITFSFVLSANAQDKPRVFVQGKGSENVASNGSGAGGRHWGTWGAHSTVDSHDEGMEVTKDLQKDCSGIIVTLNQTNADYTVILNRESKQNRGLLRANSQIQVANKMGDILGTNATRTVGNAAKDACELIVSDWQAHGRQSASASDSPTASQTPASTEPQQEPAARLQQVAMPSSATQSQPAAQTTSAGSKASGGNSLAEAARREKQHKACLELAKDNPSITCN